jgi:anti-sigma factor RsiW
MSCTEFQSALSEFVDGTLPRDRRAQVEAHVESCADCRAAVADFRRIRETARALPKAMPPEALWQKVQADFEVETKDARLGRPSHKEGLLSGPAGRLPHKDGSPESQPHSANILGFIPRSRRSVLAGLAAAAALVLATSAGVYYMTRPVGAPPAVAASSAHAQPPQTVQSIESELQLAVQHYQNAIAGLEKVAKENQAVLDPQTAAVLAKSNAILDQAVSESQAALRTQPGSEVARASLFEALQRKVSLLRDTVALINEMRKGDAAGTARVAGQLGKS